MRGALIVGWLGLAACGNSFGGGDDRPVAPIDPAPFGGFDLDLTQTQIQVPVRSEGFSSSIPAVIAAPVELDEGEVAPIVFVIHDEGFAPQDYGDLLQHLASHGMFAVGPQFDGSAGKRRSDQGLVRDLQLLMRVFRETPPVLGTVTGDPAVFGLVGHGRGAKQVVLTAARDDRVGATMFFGIDDRTSDEEPLTAISEVGDVASPLMEVQLGGNALCVPPEAGDAAVANLLPVGAVHVTAPSIGQLDVLATCRDQGGTVCAECEPGADPAVSTRFVRALAAAWMGQHVRGEAGYGLWLDDPGPAEIMEDATLTRKE